MIFLNIFLTVLGIGMFIMWISDLPNHFWLTYRRANDKQMQKQFMNWAIQEWTEFILVNFVAIWVFCSLLTSWLWLEKFLIIVRKCFLIE